MSALLAALLAFGCAFLVQVVAWRVWRPHGGYMALLVIYLGVLAAALALWTAPDMPAATLFPQSPLGLANFMGLYLSLLLAYAVTYSAVQADSPTMTILLEIERRGSQGASESELLAVLTDAALVEPRLEDLVAGGLARAREGRYVIAPRGALIARTYMEFRRLMKMEKGG